MATKYDPSAITAIRTMRRWSGFAGGDLCHFVLLVEHASRQFLAVISFLLHRKKAFLA